MNILLVLIPVTSLIVLVGVLLFFWAVNHQQFDDLESPGSLPLLDDPDQEDARADLPSSSTTELAHTADPPPHEETRT